MARPWLSSRARSDVHEIWLYLVEESGNHLRADKFFAQMVKALKMLRSSPYLGRARPELAKGLRSFVSGDYLILYYAAAGEVQVIRVVHGRRDLAALFPPESP
jgi:toxin ParE1/3/4